MEYNQTEMIRLYQIEALYNVVRHRGWLDTYAFESIGSVEEFDKWVDKLLEENPGY